MSAISECVLCGSNATGKAKVEGAIVSVCDECAKFGQVVQQVEYKVPKKLIYVPKEAEKLLIKDFHLAIRRAREKKGLTQEDLAKKLSEKHSVIKRIEEGWNPPSNLIKKLEKFFDISLQEDVVDSVVRGSHDSKELTIGDIVDID